MSTSVTKAAAEGEALLMENLRAGDGSAFETLVRTYAGRMLASARRLLTQEEEARAAVQEAFVAARKELIHLAGQTQPGTWLQRLVIHAALARLRAGCRQPERFIEEFLPRFLEDGRQAQGAVEWLGSSARSLERRE